MTLHEVANQLSAMSKTFNGELFSKTGLEKYLKHWFGNDYPIWFMTIDLPDGEWLFKVYRCEGGFDYDIPDTREKEKRLMSELLFLS